jgi:hypothetical protein
VNHVCNTDRIKFFCSQFRRLTVENQRRLLERNTPLYIQLNFGIYLSYDDVTRKIESHSDDASTANSNCWSKNFVNFKHLESRVQMFRPTVNLDDLGVMVNQLKVLSQPIDRDQRALLAYLILFNNDDSLLLTDNQGLEDTSMMNEIIFDSFIQTTNSNFELEDLTKILIKMALFCTYQLNWDGMFSSVRKDSSIVMSNIVMTFTLEEEAWLNNQFKLFDMAFRSVPAGQELIHEFLMNSLGVPVSKSYMASLFSMMMERIRKVWYIHPEFEELPVTVQRNLLRLHCFLPHALFVIRSESLTGTEQIQEGIGELDEDLFREHYLPVFDSPAKISKMTINDMLCLTPIQWDIFSQLISSAHFLVKNSNFFKINMLYLLTQPQEDDCELIGDKRGLEFLSGLHFKYKMIIQRRLKWKQDWISFQTEDQDLLINKVFSSFEIVKQISDLNQQFLTVSSP